MRFNISGISLWDQRTVGLKDKQWQKSFPIKDSISPILHFILIDSSLSRYKISNFLICSYCIDFDKKYIFSKIWSKYFLDGIKKLPRFWHKKTMHRRESRKDCYVLWLSFDKIMIEPSLKIMYFMIFDFDFYIRFSMLAIFQFLYINILKKTDSIF